MGILQPIWDGTFVYREPVCFSADKDGRPTGGTTAVSAGGDFVSHVV